MTGNGESRGVDVWVGGFMRIEVLIRGFDGGEDGGEGCPTYTVM